MEGGASRFLVLNRGECSENRSLSLKYSLFNHRKNQDLQVEEVKCMKLERFSSSREEPDLSDLKIGSEPRQVFLLDYNSHWP